MQHVLQAGLSSGMSATEGIHSSKPKRVSPEFNGLQSLMPRDWTPTSKTRITHKGAKGQNVHASVISIGAWPWGDTATWQWDDKDRPGLDVAWDHLFKAGINFIDTAQAYGNGKSEVITGELARRYPRDQVVVQTKYFVVPSAENILHPVDAPARKLKESLERMKLDFVDIYLVHGHIHLSSIAQVAKGLAACVDQGLTKCVGVANYSEKDMLQMAEELAKFDIPLATNQVEYSPLRRYPETSGLLQACKNHNIVLQSYSSLAQGRLTGKYTKDNEPPKTHRFSSYAMSEVEPVLDVLRSIAEKRGTTIPAVSLNYNMCKGLVPVVGVRNPQQAEENAKALGFRLTDEEVKAIDEVSFEGQATILWQQG
ncbi:aldo-keto reductase [Tothia fuscella]|uniref:Aldo-keto reductase n=1 Tax=Tothia fuscella TaxID=1048955 RepID=A0A9P4TRY1_9PEZI|nr:aldo-keto reductase [Tothia fuscella]